MSSLSPVPRHVFRISWRPYFLHVWPGSSLVAIIALTALDWADLSLAKFVATLGLVLAVGIPVAAVLSVVWCLYFSTEVHSAGIRGFTAWGLPCNFPWSDMGAIRINRFFGLRSIRLRSKTRWRILWIPMYTNNYDSFLHLVVGFSQPDNPLHDFARQQLQQIADRADEETVIRYIYH